MSAGRRPGFFVIGASKCGTTSLCLRLREHPQIFFSEPKEPMYFSHARERGLTLRWYESLFAGARPEHRAVGEGSTTYAAVSLFPGVETRIARYAPDARILYIVRHPLERMESQWIQRRASGSTRLDFDRAVRELREFVETNRFWHTLSAYRAAFSGERILVLFFEDYARDPAATLRRCFAFLGVDPDVALDPPGEVPNPRGALREDGALLRGVLRVPGLRRLGRALVAPRLRRSVRRPWTRPIPTRPVWDVSTCEWVSAQVVEDNRRLLAHCGKPETLWLYGREWLAATGRGA